MTHPYENGTTPRFAAEFVAVDLERAAIKGEGREPRPWDAWPSVGELVAKMGDKGPRYPLGVPPVDKAWRGGLPLGKRIAVLGAPGAGKTTWCVQLALTLAKQGVFVVYLAGDEPRDTILTRLGQQLGYEREFLEQGVDWVKEGLARELAAFGLVILDPDNDEGVTIENVAAYIVATRGERASVLFVDSLQTTAASLKTPGGIPNPKANVDLILNQTKTAARAQNISVFLLCEMNRGAYRAKDGPQATADIAAGKESGGIEYAVDAQFVLRIADSGSVDVTVPKARMGKVEPFRMTQDHRRASFTLDAPLIPHSSQDDEMRAAEFEKLCEIVHAALIRSPGTSAVALRAELRRKDADIRGALARLRDKGRAEDKSPVKNRPEWHAVTP